MGKTKHSTTRLQRVEELKKMYQNAMKGGGGNVNSCALLVS